MTILGAPGEPEAKKTSPEAFMTGVEFSTLWMQLLLTSLKEQTRKPYKQEFKTEEEGTSKGTSIGKNILTADPMDVMRDYLDLSDQRSLTHSAVFLHQAGKKNLLLKSINLMKEILKDPKLRDKPLSPDELNKIDEIAGKSNEDARLKLAKLCAPLMQAHMFKLAAPEEKEKPNFSGAVSLGPGDSFPPLRLTFEVNRNIKNLFDFILNQDPKLLKQVMPLNTKALKAEQALTDFFRSYILLKENFRKEHLQKALPYLTAQNRVEILEASIRNKLVDVTNTLLAAGTPVDEKNFKKLESANMLREVIKFIITSHLKPDPQQKMPADFDRTVWNELKARSGLVNEVIRSLATEDPRFLAIAKKDSFISPLLQEVKPDKKPAPKPETKTELRPRLEAHDTLSAALSQIENPELRGLVFMIRSDMMKLFEPLETAQQVKTPAQRS